MMSLPSIAIMLGSATSLFLFATGCLVIPLYRRMYSQLEDEASGSSRRHWVGSGWLWAFPLVKMVSAWNDPFDLSSLGQVVSRKLMSAGAPLHMTASDFVAVCELLGVASGGGGLILGAVLVVLAGAPFGLVFFLVLFGMALGFLLPYYRLAQCARLRVRLIEKDLPFAMDLMLLMIDGGATVQEAFSGVVRDGSSGPLGEELTLANREMEHGTILADALENLASRIPSDDLVMIVQAIVQGLQMGTPLSVILREQADLLRLKRSQNAEKLAKEASSKMAFPIILIMAATFLLILGPAVLKFGELKP